MKRIINGFRLGLCLLLSLQLSFPAGAWAAKSGRDLQVEELVEEFREGTTLWVLSIGVSKYEDTRINLKYADHDAIRIAQILKAQEGLLFNEVMTKVLVNEGAKREDILAAMSRFLGQASQGDMVLIFIAGHGLQDRQTNTYYFVPHNANSENLIYAGLPMPMFNEAVKRLRNNVDKLVLWMDTCHAGAVTVAARGVNMGEDLTEALRAASGQYVLSASRAGEESLEDDKYRFEEFDRAHGAFTFSLLRGLRGEAADENGVVWLSDLNKHVSKEVPRLTEGKQHPHGQSQGSADLPLFVLDESVLQLPSKPINIDLSGTVALDELTQTEAPAAVQAPTQAAAPASAAPAKSGGGGMFKWVLVALGLAAAGGGAAVALGGGGGDPGPKTGSVTIDIEVP